MMEEFKAFLIRTFSQIVQLDTDIILLAILITCTVILYDLFHAVSRKKLKETGIKKKAVTQGVDGSKTLPVADYVSDIQGLAGRPDAVIIENGFTIPVERKPLARKLRDRHVAQLLVYMRLIEEFDGKKPPYGYLILGGNCRRVKIINTPERQAWLQGIIDEMRAILDGKEAKASPTKEKCAKCDVRFQCAFKFKAAEPQLVQVRRAQGR